ncbi:MAG TPA: hypothetical protein VGS23_08690 [Thermoplasmata archaeon]|nr:hypothetical protein [Thermoplasmata archaeon]
MVLDTLEAIAGGFLILVVPGLAWTRALFPEWRIRGPLALTRAVETATLGFLLSISLTILVGFALTFNANGPFPATWSDPVLEGILALLAVVGLGVAFARGGFDRVPPAAPAPEPAPGADTPLPTLLELERLRRRSRRLEHELRRSSASAPERTRLTEELERVRAETEELRRRREADYVA